MHHPLHDALSGLSSFASGECSPCRPICFAPWNGCVAPVRATEGTGMNLGEPL